MTERRERPRSHVLTVALEDYSHVGTVQHVVRPHHWDRLENRVFQNTLATLDLLDEFGAKATFFCLGWIGENQPECIREVVSRGHEVASKGYWHRPIRSMTPEEFRQDASRSREVLEAAGQARVLGYRAAQGWMVRDEDRVFEALSDCGYVYDSSSFNRGVVRHADDEARRFLEKHQIDESPFWEVPISSLRVGPIDLPVGGGNYVRQFPHALMRRAVGRWVDVNPAPLVFYFHIWELDPEQPRIQAAPRWQRIRQYRNLHSMNKKLRHYLSQYKFTSIADYLGLDTQIIDQESKVKQNTASVFGVSSGDNQKEERVPVTIVVPCYNEEASVPTLANALGNFEKSVSTNYILHYVFVDDGSSDSTWDRLRDKFGGQTRARLVRHPRNLGVAAAALTGLANTSTEIACVIDCDLTYDLKHLSHMIPMLVSNVDVVTASPYHTQGCVVNVPGWRLFLSKRLSWLYRRVLRHSLMTYTSCFRVYRVDTVKDISLFNKGFVGIVEILMRVEERGGRIIEYPAFLEARLLGRSKMKILRTIIAHLKLITTVFLSQSKRKPLPVGKKGVRALP